MQEIRCFRGLLNYLNEVKMYILKTDLFWSRARPGLNEDVGLVLILIKDKVLVLPKKNYPGL